LVEEPTLRLISIMLKYRPWRVKLFSIWQQHHASESGCLGVTVCERAKLLLKVLRRLCEEMDGRREVQVWGATLGRGVARAAGPLAFLNRLSVLLTPSQSARPLMLGGGASLAPKRLCRGVRESHKAVQKLTRWVNLADALGAPCGPKTCAEWVDQHKDALQKFKQNQVLTGNDASYVKNWLIRASLLAAMHRSGVTRLSGSSEIHTKDFAVAFPDSKKWISFLQQPGCNGTLAEFLDYLEYSEPPEMLTMHLCLTLTREMWRPVAWYKARCLSLRLRMREGSGCLGLNLLPALCVKEELRQAGKP
jgi:hypothetical protein